MSHAPMPAGLPGSGWTEAGAQKPSPQPKAPQCCAGCRFWVQKSTRPGQSETCRRFPPTKDIGSDCGRTWPHALATDWCGEWRARQ